MCAGGLGGGFNRIRSWWRFFSFPGFWGDFFKKAFSPFSSLTSQTSPLFFREKGGFVSSRGERKGFLFLFLPLQTFFSVWRGEAPRSQKKKKNQHPNPCNTRPKLFFKKVEWGGFFFSKRKNSFAHTQAWNGHFPRTRIFNKKNFFFHMKHTSKELEGSDLEAVV